MAPARTVAQPATGIEPRNEVTLCGRVTLAAAERTLPSGDVVLSTRITVDRPSTKSGRGGGARSRQRVDSIDCVAWPARLRSVMRRWEPGDVVLVSGSLRRRFYRGSGGPISRFEVEVTQARRVAAGARAAASEPESE